MRGLFVLPGVVAALLLLPASSQAGRFQTYVVCGSYGGAAATCYEGDLPSAVFRDFAHRHTHYRVCVSGPGGHYCRARSSGTRGHRTRMFLPSTGLGTYTVRWRVHGKVVGQKRYTLAGEGV